MRLSRKSQAQRLGDTVKDTLDKDKAVKAGLVAASVAALTAGSAGISSIRRRWEGARGSS